VSKAYPANVDLPASANEVMEAAFEGATPGESNMGYSHEETIGKNSLLPPSWFDTLFHHPVY
jgi:hypothetical protein